MGRFTARLIATSAFVLLAAGLGSALAQAAGKKLYWTDANWFDTVTARVSRANADGSGVEGLITPGGVNHAFLAIAGEQIYWADSSNTAEQSIRRANIDGTGNTLVLTTWCPFGVAIDEAHGKLYWTDACEHMIRRANLDGSMIETLVSGLGAPLIGSPQGLVLDVPAGKMYWANTADGLIQRANLDGTEIQDLTATPSPHGLALDLAAGKIYWAGSGAIGRANLDGTEVEVLTYALRNPIGIAVDHASGYLYWTDLFPGEIWRADLEFTASEPIITGLDTPWGLVLLDASDNPPEISVEATPAVLWPPDHRMVPITVAVMAGDAEGPVSVALRSVTSNEPNAVGGGATLVDVADATFGADDRELLLRAERAGTGSGRIYTLTYEATDSAGQVTEATTTVTVPLSMRWGARFSEIPAAPRGCASVDRWLGPSQPLARPQATSPPSGATPCPGGPANR